MRNSDANLRPALAWAAVWLCLTFPAGLAAQNEERPAASDETPANPLSNLLNQVFGGGEKTSTPDEGAVGRYNGETDDLHARPLGGSYREARNLAQADLALSSGEWQTAIELLQPILDQPQDRIIPLEGGVGRTLRAEAEARIGRMPPAGIAVYQAEFGRIAEQMLAQARGPDALREMAVVSNQYFHTAAGKQATSNVASLLFDRGEYEAAAAWYSRLTGDPALSYAAGWRARASYALIQSGDPQSAQPMLEALDRQPAGDRLPAAGPDGSLADWIRKRPGAAASTPELTDWLTLYGSSAHVGVAPPGEPLLMERWSQPLTARYRLHQRIRDLLMDLEDHRRAGIPAGVPIVSGESVAFRTLRGLAVVDANTGQLLWENDPELKAEVLLTDQPQRGGGPYTRFRAMARGDNFSGGELDSLKDLLFRDAAYGLLSSDGRRVFSIENSVLFPLDSYNSFGRGESPSENDAYRRDWASNQIHAYDLASGELLWETGGRRMNEPFDPPLAGVFFLSPPVPDCEELFVVGEQDAQIHLFALSRQTGHPLWSQTIVEPETPIDQDRVRRLWTCTPAVHGGLIICPTAAGWLVAINRHTQHIEWAHRFSDPPDFRTPSSQSNANSRLTLNKRWCAAAPIVAGGNVFFTPPEQPDAAPNAAGQNQPQLVCLDARTGNRRWTRKKGNSLYLAGVFDGSPLLVGRDEIMLINPADGAPVWTTPITDEAGPPSGRGIALGSRFLLPLRSGQLWSIDLLDGSVRRQGRLPGGTQAAPLGNLVVCQGMLVSLGPSGLVGFEQRAALEQQIASRLASNPHDLWAAVKQAEIHVIAGDHVAALRVLAQAEPGSADDPDLGERRRSLMFDSQIAVLKQQPNAGPEEFGRAAQLATQVEEKLELERVLVQREIAHGLLESAFDRCERITSEFSLDEMVDDGPTSLRLDVWLGGQLADLTGAAPPELAASLAERIASRLETVSLAPPMAASLERLYGFHPAAETFLWRLIDDAAYRKDFAGAEVRLRRLIREAEPRVVAAALARLGDLMLDYGRQVEGAHIFARLETEFSDELLPSLKTGAEAARDRFASGIVSRADLQPPPRRPWSNGRYRVSHHRVVNSVHGMPQAPVTCQLRSPFFRRHAFEFDAQSSFLTVVRREDDELYWRLPLRTAGTRDYDQSAAVFGQGLQAVVWRSGMVHALSLPDRRVLWSRTVSGRTAPSYARRVYDNSDATLYSSNSFAARVGLTRNPPLTGRLALVNERHIACHGRGEFVVLDPLTGDVLWRRRGLERDTKLIGDAATICIVPNRPNAVGAIAVRARDGRPVEIDKLPAILKSTIAVTSAGFIRAERTGRRASRASRTFRISAFDPQRQATAWSHDFAPRSSFTFVDDAHLLALDETSGACSLLDVQSGELLPLGAAPADAVSQSSERYAIADRRQVYLVLNESRNNRSGYIHPPALRTNGTVVALARDGSGQSWEQTVENQNLLRPGFQQSPLLVFLAYDHVHLPDIEEDYNNSRLVVLDKADGRVVAEDERASPNGNYYRIDVDPKRRAIDIHAHNERVRIEAAPPAEPPDDS